MNIDLANQASYTRDVHTLEDLFKTPVDQRDAQWEDQFFTQLCESSLNFASTDPQTGPDGWPYLMVETGGHEPAQRVLQWLSTRGIGLVINPQKEYPDFVFSWGMLWHFQETGLFFRRQSPPPNTNESKTWVHAGTPTPQYLPGYVRSVLKEFFRDQGVLQPKILVASVDRIHYDLVFSVESLKNPPAHEHEGILEAISWFLPPHYTLVLESEKSGLEFTLL